MIKNSSPFFDDAPIQPRPLTLSEYRRLKAAGFLAKESQKDHPLDSAGDLNLKPDFSQTKPSQSGAALGQEDSLNPLDCRRPDEAATFQAKPLETPANHCGDLRLLNPALNERGEGFGDQDLRLRNSSTLTLTPAPRPLEANGKKARLKNLPQRLAKRFLLRPLIVQSWSALTTRLNPNLAKDLAPPKVRLYILGGLAIGLILVFFRPPWLVVLLIALPLLAGLAVLAAETFRRRLGLKKDPKLNPPPRPGTAKNPPQPQKGLFLLALMSLWLMTGCAGAFDLNAKNAKGQGDLDPVLAFLGQETSEVLWRRSLIEASPQFPLKIASPKELSQSSGLTRSWSGPANEAVVALAKTIGYEAKIALKRKPITVVLRPDPHLSVYDHLRSLNQSLAPNAGILIDPVNRILTLKGSPFSY
ncbi:MAG: DotD/TraH family lipoprotein [Deltaproteobacteria bacterium]|jgi:hypothetical protein|nr:DotD/TraH family lipoprotein [Deltaproteobacteria bacterium]